MIRGRSTVHASARALLAAPIVLACAVAASTAAGSPPARVVYCGNGSLSNATLFVSRSGGRIGAVIGFPPGPQAVAAVSVAGGSQKSIQGIYAGNDGSLLWSHDASLVATHPVFGVLPSGGTPDAPLLIGDFRTGTVRTLMDGVTARAVEALDDWSPDNGQLLANRRVTTATGTASELELIDTQTGHTRDLVAGEGGVFSQDGSEIAFESSDGGLVLFNLASGQQTPLPVFDAGPMSWSPDGTAIAYRAQGNPSQLFVLHLGTKSVQLVGTNPVGGFTWSGKSLIWTTGSGITVTDTSTGKARTVYPLPPSSVTKTTAPPQTLPVGVLPGQRIVYEIPGRGYRTISITGSSDERLLACRGKGYGDKVVGSQLNDLINVRNGTLDTVDCKTGNDSVLADRVDRVARNCETVRR